ncbi:MAG: hypothetical protein V4581_17900 [Bacteroidota bacterium]
MNNLETPQFSNSCGKLFPDRVLLATSSREAEFELNKVSNVSFKGRPQIKSLLFLAFPIILFILPLFVHNADVFIKVVFAVIGILFLIITLFNIQKKYTLTLYLKDNTRRSIDVWQGNRKEAEKFAEKIKIKLARRQASQ